jgi:5,10-methylenetetrahydrofolate reductase
MTLDEVYFEKIEIANKNEMLSQFIFKHEKLWYFVQWYKNKWSEPVKIVEL